MSSKKTNSKKSIKPKKKSTKMSAKMKPAAKKSVVVKKKLVAKDERIVPIVTAQKEPVNVERFEVTNHQTGLVCVFRRSDLVNLLEALDKSRAVSIGVDIVKAH